MYKIYVADENDKFNIVIKENGVEKTFDCVYAAERYAKSVGLKSGFVIK